MINAEPVVHGRPHSVPPREPRQAEGPTLFRFPFQKRYGGLYSNRHDKFVLREEHIAELKRLVVEHNREGSGHVLPLSMSDIVNTSLDFALEHPGAFLNHQRGSAELRAMLAHEVYRRALVHFMLHEFI